MTSLAVVTSRCRARIREVIIAPENEATARNRIVEARKKKRRKEKGESLSDWEFRRDGKSQREESQMIDEALGQARRPNKNRENRESEEIETRRQIKQTRNDNGLERERNQKEDGPESRMEEEEREKKRGEEMTENPVGKSAERESRTTHTTQSSSESLLLFWTA